MVIVSGEMESLRRMLSSIREPCIKAVILFGSKARGESEDRSDVDLLVLHDGCGIKDAVLRRRRLYSLLKEKVGEADLTVIDMELKNFLKPNEVSSLLLNIYWDAVILYDSTGLIDGFLNEVRDKISASGLRRVKSGRAYYWVLPEPLKEVKIL